MFAEDEYLQLSGIQHFAFCRRQWALIHIENQWAENFRTTDGELLHEKAHDSSIKESRGDIKIARAVYVHSPSLGISGQCDVVEFRRDVCGVAMSGWEGTWLPYPVEYKRGRPMDGDADVLQLCAQAMCLEEMLCCEIPQGALFYGETRRRLKVDFTKEMREKVKTLLEEMHQLYRKGHTPTVKPSKSCNACSLKDICVPKLMRKRSAVGYMRENAED